MTRRAPHWSYFAFGLNIVLFDKKTTTLDFRDSFCGGKKIILLVKNKTIIIYQLKIINICIII